MQDYVADQTGLKQDTVYIIGEGVKNRRAHEKQLRLARENGTSPVPPGYPLSEVLRQRELFGDN